MWDGVTSFAGHAVLWLDDRLKWSDLNDFTTWYPVAQTAVSAVLPLSLPFTQPALGGTVPVTVTNPVDPVTSLTVVGPADFGSVEVGAPSPTGLINIINTGTAPATITGISFSPADDGTVSGGAFTGTLPGGASSVT